MARTCGAGYMYLAKQGFLIIIITIESTHYEYRVIYVSPYGVTQKPLMTDASLRRQLRPLLKKCAYYLLYAICVNCEYWYFTLVSRSEECKEPARKAMARLPYRLRLEVRTSDYGNRA